MVEALLSCILACPLTKQSVHVSHVHICFAALGWFIFTVIVVSHAKITEWTCMATLVCFWFSLKSFYSSEMHFRSLYRIIPHPQTAQSVCSLCQSSSPNAPVELGTKQTSSDEPQGSVVGLLSSPNLKHHFVFCIIALPLTPGDSHHSFVCVALKSTLGCENGSYQHLQIPSPSFIIPLPQLSSDSKWYPVVFQLSGPMMVEQPTYPCMLSSFIPNKWNSTKAS